MLSMFFEGYLYSLAAFWTSAVRIGLPHILLLVMLFCWLRRRKRGGDGCCWSFGAGSAAGCCDCDCCCGNCCCRRRGCDASAGDGDDQGDAHAGASRDEA